MKKKVPPPTESFDSELAKQKVKEQFRTGKSLKPVYRADNEPIALDELAKLKEKWEKKYSPIKNQKQLYIIFL